MFSGPGHSWLQKLFSPPFLQSSHQPAHSNLLELVACKRLVHGARKRNKPFGNLPSPERSSPDLTVTLQSCRISADVAKSSEETPTILSLLLQKNAEKKPASCNMLALGAK